MNRPDVDELIGGRPNESTSVVAARVFSARERAAERGVRFNSALAGSALDELAPMSRAAATLVEKQVRAGSLTARGLHRVHRLARTVADLGGDGEQVEESHVREALLLRSQRDLLLGGDGR
jgi:magnesium chelatase family protein